MNKRLGTVGSLSLGLVVALVGGDAQAHSKGVLVREGVCEEMSAQFWVDAEIARSKVPSDYDLLLSGSSALIFVVTKLCSYEVDGRLAETKEFQAFIGVAGPPLVAGPPPLNTVCGAPGYAYCAYFYHLFALGQAPGWLSRALRKFGYKGLSPSVEIEIEPFGAIRSGHVVERRAGGRGYRWTEHTRGFTSVYPAYFFFYDRRYRVEGPYLVEVTGTGDVVLEIDPGTSLADFGSVLTGSTTDHILTKRIILYND